MRIFRIFTRFSLSAELERVIKSLTLFDQRPISPCPPSFTFTFFGISDRWRIERGVSARRTPGIPEKPPASLAVFFSPHAFETFVVDYFLIVVRPGIAALIAS
ncbi:hypothetical protein PQQ51_29090 [Paraburkholderia xenovorans]|uniref:hypothetical protein n=1 Tax=Paraburkholderia xenovorans TaxID=36873 RepID=UPI0038BCCEA1